MEASDIQVARLDERMKMLLQRMEENHESNLNVRGWMARVDGRLMTIEGRVGNVESSLAKSAPTIEEFMAIKHKVMGAGMAGRWVWISAGALLGLIISAKEHIARFLTS